MKKKGREKKLEIGRDWLKKILDLRMEEKWPEMVKR
jgi:hypothetical protein